MATNASSSIPRRGCRHSTARWAKSGSPARASSSGYWRRPEDTIETFGATLATGGGPTYLRTGDLGFVHEHELFVTGRRKDLIIVRGRNHYPQDIEETAQTAYPGLRPGCCAAFSVEVEGEERLVAAVEVGPSFDGQTEAAAAAIRRAIVESHELQTQAVVLLKHGTLPKTSSGKIQRRACRAAYLNGTLDAVAQIVQRDGDVKGIVALPCLDDLTTLSDGDRRERVRQFVRALATQTLSVPHGSLEATRPLSEQGLDSLRAIELKHELDARFGADLSMAELLGGMSAAQLAERLEPCRPGAAAAPPLTAAPIEFDLSYGQRALWYLHQLTPHGSAYNICRCGPAPAGTGPRVPPASRSRRSSNVIPRCAPPTPRAPASPTSGSVRQTDLILDVQDAADWDEEALARQPRQGSPPAFRPRARSDPARHGLHARRGGCRAPDRGASHRRRFLVARDGRQRTGPPLRGRGGRTAMRPSSGAGLVRRPS